MNPYSAKPDYAFWSRSVARGELGSIDPVTSFPFRLSTDDVIATAGSCFAQHISRTLKAKGYRYLVTEAAPADSERTLENYGVFPARFGNIYTVRQLLQTFDRAYGLFEPVEAIWRRGDAFIDPFRPQIERDGFPTMQALEQDRNAHLVCVRQMFEQCSVFIFTLGLTESWMSKLDGAVYPLAPGVSGGELTSDHKFYNFSVAETLSDLTTFVGKLRVVNPTVRIILTVSPVPLKATFEDRHVLVSNTYSKAALRVVAEEICRSDPGIAYFPSYEIITSGGARFYDYDRRNITQAGVNRVMEIFSRHILDSSPTLDQVSQSMTMRDVVLSEQDRDRFDEIAAVVCEEDALEQKDAD